MTTSRRAVLTALLILAALFPAACDRIPPVDLPAVPDGGADLGDPEVGGGAGEMTGPETPLPTFTPTREPSPRLDATAAATLVFPPTAIPTQPPPPPPTTPASADTPAPEAPTVESAATATPAPPTAAPDEPTPTGPTPTAAERIHVVQAGENLYRIGLQYGLSWVAIADYNGIADPNQIEVGQELRIPPAPTPTAEATESSAAPDSAPVEAAAPAATTAPEDPKPPASVEATHRVAPGDTLYRLARVYGVTWMEIAEANGLTTANQIVAGQVLKIPVSAPGPARAFTHRVRAGDTLTRIAAQYGLSPADLAAANGLEPPYVIFAGQVLTISPGE